MTTDKALKKDDNIVLIGAKKPANKYATAIKMQFENFKAEEVVLKARGNATYHCVQAIEIAKARYFPNMTTETEYSTEIFENKIKGEPPIKVAVMQVTLKLPKKQEEEKKDGT